MRSLITAGAVIAASISGTTADLCYSGPGGASIAQNIPPSNPNWYCAPVKAITYQGVGTSGSYKKVTSMTEEGQCQFADHAFSGGMAPLSEEVSIHFRGPLKLKQLAVYTKGSSQKRDVPEGHHRRHGHQHFHEHGKEVREIQERAEEREIQELKARAEEEMAKRGDCDPITATWKDGTPMTWANTAPGCGATPASGGYQQGDKKQAANGAPAAVQVTSSASAAASSSASASASATSSASSGSGSSSDSGSSSGSSGSSSSGGGSGPYSRTAYYSASGKSSSGLTFLNNRGDKSKSGCWSQSLGNSLSYASSDGTSAASQPTTLDDCTIASTSEVIVMTDKKYSGGNAVRPCLGDVARQGFPGQNAVYLFEFSMPDDGTSGWGQNMPAIWFLNANVPRTAQYGSCTCWPSCGEFDIFEVLDSGNTRAKTCFHGKAQEGGVSDYFVRPTSNTIKLAVTLSGSTAHVQIVDDNTNFGSSLSDSDVQALNSKMDNGGDSSVFKMA
ncbi:MAG: target of Sbf [Candelina submexicana]|nr:MAG: target of Sbf [Candelina submexicana]